jgi:hypothetical protein
MKSFLTLKELLDYCYLCPICSSKRNFTISIGPDHPQSTSSSIITELDDYDVIRLEHGDHRDDFLYLSAKVHWSTNRYLIDFIIDTLTNQVRSNITVFDGDPKPTVPQMYFSIWSRCSQCYLSQLNTHDINIDIDRKTLYPLDVEYEGRSVIVGEEGYYLEYDEVEGLENEIAVWRVRKFNATSDSDPDLPPYYETYGKMISLPMTEFDFSNLGALHKRLSTLVFFS